MSPQQLSSLSKIGFLLLPNFSMIALTNAVEPLRMANQLSRKKLYQWTMLSADGEPVSASNGLSLSPITKADDAKQFDMLFVCGGINVREAINAETLAVIRKFANDGVLLGGICTGTYALAKAGVLNGYRCTIHWEYLSSIREQFPRTEFTPELFVIDRDRFTCSGGTAPIDLMCYLIRFKGGRGLASDVSDQFILERIRDPRDQQNIPLLSRIGAGHELLLDAAMAMEMNIETPCSLEKLANDLVGISPRHLERLFKRYLNTTPAKYYTDLRLRRARNLLLQTNMSVMEVSVACGFISSSHFSKAYRNLFGYPPVRERYMQIHQEVAA